MFKQVSIILIAVPLYAMENIERMDIDSDMSEELSSDQESLYSQPQQNVFSRFNHFNVSDDKKTNTPTSSPRSNGIETRSQNANQTRRAHASETKTARIVTPQEISQRRKVRGHRRFDGITEKMSIDIKDDTSQKYEIMDIAGRQTTLERAELDLLSDKMLQLKFSGGIVDSGAQNNELQELIKLIQKGMPLSKIHLNLLQFAAQKNEPLIHEAVKYNSLETVRSLIEACPELLQIKDAKGQTALHVAALKGDVNKIATIVKKCTVLLYQQDSIGNIPSDLAIEHLKKEAASYLCSLQRQIPRQ
jgi:hypothetical protein